MPSVVLQLPFPDETVERRPAELLGLERREGEGGGKAWEGGGGWFWAWEAIGYLGVFLMEEGLSLRG